MTSLEAFISPEDQALLAAPIGAARGLPGAAYSAAFYALEQRRLFPRVWAPIGVGADIPNPGDLAPVDLAGYPLIMARQANGAIKVLHNICRHRAMKLVSAPCAGARLITCPWHGWTFGVDGALRHTTRLGGETVHAAAGFDAADLDLVEARSATWLDYVFVNLDGAAPPFEEHIAPFASYLAGLDIHGLRRDGAWRGAYPGNWKVAVEGGIEDYHLPMAHSQILEGVVSRTATIETGPGFAATCSRETLVENGARFHSPLSGLPRLNHPAGEYVSRIISLFPTGVIVTGVDHVLLALFTPAGPAETRLEFNLYWPAAAFDHPDYAEKRRLTLEDWIHIAQQDDTLVRGVQEAAAVRDLVGVRPRFSPYWEGAVLHFQRMVVRALAA